MGTCFTFITFTIFSIGDHVFGDRFELLEHTLFWFIPIHMVGIYSFGVKGCNQGLVLNKRQILGASIISILLVLTSFSIFSYNEIFRRMTQ